MSSSSLVTYVASRRCSLFQLHMRPSLSHNTMCDVASDGCYFSASSCCLIWPSTKVCPTSSGDCCTKAVNTPLVHAGAPPPPTMHAAPGSTTPFSSCCTLLVKINISSIDHGYRLRNKKKSSRTMIFSLQKMRFQ